MPIIEDYTAFNEQDLFDYAHSRGFGDLHLRVDQETGLRSIIAIHSNKNGPALGGCRCYNYLSTSAAIRDAMRLARAMSYKSALLNLPLGGGKSIVIKPIDPADRKKQFRAFGRFINELNGRYIVSVDIGTTLDDMEDIASESKYVATRNSHKIGPSLFTAKGILQGIKAAVKFKLNKNSLAGIHVAIQGVGKVGYQLAEYLHAEGAKLTLADACQELALKCANEFHAQTVMPSDIHKVDCDVFAPCALGAVINKSSIEEIQACIIAGSANNQLYNAEDGLRLHKKGILFAPDYIINSGGLVHAAGMYLGESVQATEEKLNTIHDTLYEIFEQSLQKNLPTSTIADQIAMSRL